MSIERLEKAVQDRLLDCFKSVRPYRGELEKLEMIRATAGNTPTGLVYVSNITAGSIADQRESEEVEITVVMILSSQNNDVHRLRKQVNDLIKGYDADGLCCVPLRWDRTETLAITTTTSIYATVFKCELMVD